MVHMAYPHKLISTKVLSQDIMNNIKKDKIIGVGEMA